MSEYSTLEQLAQPLPAMQPSDAMSLHAAPNIVTDRVHSIPLLKQLDQYVDMSDVLFQHKYVRIIYGMSPCIAAPHCAALLH